MIVALKVHSFASAAPDETAIASTPRAANTSSILLILSSPLSIGVDAGTPLPARRLFLFSQHLEIRERLRNRAFGLERRVAIDGNRHVVAVLLLDLHGGCAALSLEDEFRLAHVA